MTSVRRHLGHANPVKSRSQAARFRSRFDDAKREKR
jgi:hypothetical protein